MENIVKKESIISGFYAGAHYVSDSKAAVMANDDYNEIVMVHEPVYQLCGYRHDNPITHGLHVFEQVIEKPLDMYGLEKYAEAFLLSNGYGISGRHKLYVLVTGLTTALIALLNATITMSREQASDIDVCLLHWDRDTRCYVKQWVYSKKGGE